MKCPHCSRDFEPIEGQRFCPLCGEKLDTPAPGPSEPVGRESYREEPQPEPFETERIEYCPWEDQENLGFSEALGQTLRQSMFGPTAFFEKMPVRGGVLLPVLYAMIVGTIGSMASYLWSVAVGGNVLSEWVGSGRNAVFFALVIPLVVFLGIFIWGVILHVSLFLVGGAKEDFEATFRVVCYASGPELLGVVPVIGGLASLIWKIYMTVAGLRAAHGVSNARAVAALALPGLVCCGVGVATVFSVSLLVGSH